MDYDDSSGLSKEEATGDKDDDILAQAREHYRLCVEADQPNRDEAIADLNFKLGGDNQWDERAVAQRRNAGRPIITVNQLPTFLHQVTNDQRMNTPSIKVHPVGYGSDEETAKVRQGLIRHIEYDTNADIAYDMAGTSAAEIGWGYWYLDTEFESATSFDQKICFRNVPNTLAVRRDPLSTEIDGSDMQFAFIEGLQNKQDFKREYPDANACSPEWVGQDAYSMWIQEDTVLVCRYYVIKKEKATVIELTNGETGYKDELIELPFGVQIAREREGTRSKVMCYKMTGVDILERTEIKMVKGPWIPIFPVYGDRTFIEGRVYMNGIIRNAKGPCQSFNVMISGATEEVSLRSKSPYIGAAGFMEGFEDDWEQANNVALPALEYNPKTVDGMLAPPPQRQPMADIPAGMLAMTMHARDNIKAVTGLYDSSLGSQGNATSGKQEIAQQRQGDISNFHFTDNRNKSVLHCGRVINAMIPAYYDAERVVQIMRPDDSVEHVTINQQLPAPQQNKQTGAIQEVLNDMTGGEYSITMSAGPSYSTMRQESQEFFTQAMSAAKDPVTNGIVTYLAMQSSDAPGAELATKMLKTVLPPPVQAVIDEEKNDEQEEMVNTPKGPIPVAQIPQILSQQEQQLQQANEQLQKADGDKQAAEASKQQVALLAQQNAQQQLAIDGERLRIEQYNAETARIEAQTAQMEAQETSVSNHERAIIDATNQETERMRISEESRRAEFESEAENVRSATATASAKESKPAPKSMQIKAPSGGMYEVTLQ